MGATTGWEPTRRQLLAGLGALACIGLPRPATATVLLHTIEVLTGGARPTEDLPLVVAIHGYGDHPSQFKRLFSGFPGRARILLPRGPNRIGRGWGWFTRRSAPLSDLAAGLEHATEAVAQTIRMRIARGGTTGLPIVTGFSQGGMLSFALALRHPEVTGAAFPVAGWLTPSLVPPTVGRGGVPIVAFHGTSDPLLPFADTHRLMAYLQARSHPAEFRVYDGVGHTITPEMRRDLFGGLTEALPGR